MRYFLREENVVVQQFGVQKCKQIFLGIWSHFCSKTIINLLQQVGTGQKDGNTLLSNKVLYTNSNILFLFNLCLPF